MFKRKATETQEPPPGEVTGWKVVAELSGGRTFTLSSLVYEMGDTAESLRICDAVVDGLRRAGFQATAVVTREQREARA